MNFNKDRKIGTSGEILVVSLYDKCGCLHSEIVNSEFYDIITTGYLEFTTEVKVDVVERYSGNIAIEYYNPKSNKPSGINNTRADFWVCVLYPQYVWLANTNVLKDYISKNSPLRTVIGGGDNNSNFHLYKSSKILADIFIRIDNLDDESLLRVLQDARHISC